MIPFRGTEKITLLDEGECRESFSLISIIPAGKCDEIVVRRIRLDDKRLKEILLQALN